MKNKQSGISLIIVVVTIIVILILVVVTVRLATEKRLFDYAKEAKNQTDASIENKKTMVNQTITKWKNKRNTQITSENTVENGVI